jgi:hypothetical protein
MQQQVMTRMILNMTSPSIMKRIQRGFPRTNLKQDHTRATRRMDIDGHLQLKYRQVNTIKIWMLWYEDFGT